MKNDESKTRRFCYFYAMSIFADLVGTDHMSNKKMEALVNKQTSLSISYKKDNNLLTGRSY